MTDAEKLRKLATWLNARSVYGPDNVGPPPLNDTDLRRIADRLEALETACEQFMGPMGMGGCEGEHSMNCHMRFSTYPPQDCTCGIWLAKKALKRK